MTEKAVNPVLKQILELGPPIAFFLIYTRIKDNTYTILGTDYSGFIVATLVFIPMILAAIGVLWFLTRTISRIQIFTAFMVIFFGSLTAWFNDERFFMMKTTIVYGVFVALLGIGLLRGKSALKYIMGDMLPMRDEGWMILTRRLTFLFAALAVANEIIWRTQSQDTWVLLETFAFPAVTMVYLMAQFVLLKDYLIEDN